MKRPISIGSRVYTVFWNEITEQKFGRGPNNPITHRGTVISGGSGKFTVRFEAAESADNANLVNAWRKTGHVNVSCDAWNLHREGDPITAITRRADFPWATAKHEHGPHDLWQRRWDYRSYLLYPPPKWMPAGLSIKAWSRRRRFNVVRWAGVYEAQEALKERAKQYGIEKRRDLFLAQMLQTPMQFPPDHPGCDQPIYPVLNEARTGLGDGWVCRIHGNVTEAMTRAYYPETNTTRTTTPRRTKRR